MFYFNSNPAGGESRVLATAAGYYAAKLWGEDEWMEFGREIGTLDIVTRHDRLLRSWSFGDPDYPDACISVMSRVLSEAPDPKLGEAGKMDILRDAMPDLRKWVQDSAPERTKRLFEQYLSARASSEIPEEWGGDANPGGPEDALEACDPLNSGIAHTGIEASIARSGSIDLPQDHSESNDPIAGSPTPPSMERVTPVAGDATSAHISTLTTQVTAPIGAKQIFIVHGHDQVAVDSVRIFVHDRTGVMPTSLQALPGASKTIIEKFEDSGARADIAIILLTPDDAGATKVALGADGELEARARQNVVLEMGYFIGKIGRPNVIVLNAGVEIPSDISGVSYIKYPGDSWKDELLLELRRLDVKSL